MLVSVLSATEPHFIRAIKPNNSKQPNTFDGNSILRYFELIPLNTILLAYDHLQSEFLHFPPSFLDNFAMRVY